MRPRVKCPLPSCKTSVLSSSEVTQPSFQKAWNSFPCQSIRTEVPSPRMLFSQNALPSPRMLFSQFFPSPRMLLSPFFPSPRMLLSQFSPSLRMLFSQFFPFPRTLFCQNALTSPRMVFPLPVLSMAGSLSSVRSLLTCHLFKLLRWISSGDLIYSMVTIVTNTVLHTWKLLREKS